MPSIFLDANLPMYAAGASHPLKRPCIDSLAVAHANPAAFVTDSEVFQEIIHRYTSIRRWVAGREIFREFSELMEYRIAPVLFEDVSRAATLADELTALDSRDLLHLAIMQRFGITRIVSTDPGFDGLPGIERLDPMKVDEWRDTVTA
jgi:predicted nucleic acid-binding protein